ncbi:Nonribosomal peptide synthetase 12 [Trichoderma lentiforme]|uniref:Nonribosomal peptide synthetase 12 n=1 Tax=Trichoderma lentiforme TaxID=1567552 RepID=A0A9P4X2F9_9HYPO|nr:Nonribosomal peptide synthetase 12 [Trichoderma lentiforme]
MLSSDLNTIWTWNATVPAVVERCVHDIFIEIAHEQPESPAICAWDGELTYGHLDELSTRLSIYLTEVGIGPGTIVPLCFEKSVWMPVAMLGVMKAGGASVALDSSQPVERLLGIIQQVGSHVILTSSSNYELASKLTKSTPIIVDRESLTSHQFKTTVGEDDSIRPASVPTKPSDLLYVVFTSGSTGTPKGAMISHSNFSSAARYQQPFLHLHRHSRIYDFASYSFDVSWANFLNAITSGGCLCIPSEHDRKNRIEDSMRELRANYVEATPSVAELLNPESLPKLDVLVLGGELLVQDRLLCIHVPGNVINTYGPAECTITSTGVKVMPGDPDIKSIGRGLGTIPWVVDPDNHDRLVPLGDVGELLIEGPLVGQGYLNDPARTEAAFIDTDSTNLSEDEVQVKMAAMAATLNETLAQQLPSYMIPTAYVPLTAIPITPNGKTDRRGLREEGRRLIASRFVRDGSTGPQLSGIQTWLAGLWVQAVKNPHLVVGLLDNFFTIGGDSIGAMRLVSLARNQGIMLTVSEVFLRPTLQQMASKLETLSMSHGRNLVTQSLQEKLPNTMSELSSTILPEYLDRLGPVEDMDRESPQQKLGELHGAERHDIAEMLGWVRVIPESHEFIHHAVSDYALNRSSSEAICAWDGRMTYAELDSCSSALAEYLIHVGTKPEQMIPMLMEKSKWAVVSILAIFKAGGIYVPLDPNYPQARLRAITAQIDAQTCLTSVKQKAISSELFSTRVVVEEFFQSAVLNNMCSSWKKLTMTPSSGAYTIFTSGSTGEPKGVIVEHKALMHSAREHGKAFKMSCTTRTLQFCSFTFDVSLAEILTTLLYGGCVCIPSDSERLDSLSRAITRFGVNCALLTPSVASTITPKAVPTLKSLVLCGEPMNDSHVSMWSKAVHLINGYGPTECAIFSVINTSGMIESDPTVIGHATGCNAWVVDSTDHNILLPIGAIGELLLEGPLLARGYLNDLGKTEASFVEISSWTSMAGLNPGTRFYKTGDLVRFNNDGTLTYIGRKDLQIKLHGQRMEIADVESHLRQVFGYRQDVIEVHADIVKPYGSADPHLVAFFRLKQGIDIHDQCFPGSERDAITTLFNDAKGRLLARIPRHMVPTLFVPIKSLPVTSAGKLDRKTLRAMASRLTTTELTRFTTTGKARANPKNELERKMQDIWSIALGVDKSLIGRGDNFFELGGDSMSALRVAVKAQAEGISILTSDVFTNPVLAPLCGMISSKKEHGGMEQNNDKRALVGRLASDEDINTISRQLGIEADAIEDIYEATSYQSFATVTTLLKSRGNINYYFFIVDGPLDKARLRQACRKVFKHHNLLRTVFTASRRRALQVVLKSPEFVFEYFDNIKDPEGFVKGMIDDDFKAPVLLGELMTRFALIQNGDEQSVLFMRLSHAQYDGVSLERMKANLENEYNGLHLLSGPKFVDYFHYANTSAAEAFWTKYLKGSKMTQLVNHQGPAYRNIFDYLLERRIPARTLRYRGITDASLAKAAWAHTLALLTGSLDLVFGVLTSGRNAAIPGIEDIDGPTVNQTPFRVQLQEGGKVIDLLQNVQEQQAMTMPYESTPFSHIIEKYTNWPKWSRFSSIVHHASILDIKSMKLGDTGCRIESFANECDTTDIWVRSNFIDDQFHIILAASSITIPQDLLQVIMDIFCEKIAEFASDPDAALEDPLARRVADSMIPLFPKNTLPSRPQLSQDVDFVNSPFRALVEKAWDEILCIHETEFREQDVEITPDTAFFDVWGNMLAAQQFADFYSAYTTKTILLEDIVDYPSMRGHVFLLGQEESQ